MKNHFKFWRIVTHTKNNVLEKCILYLVNPSYNIIMNQEKPHKHYRTEFSGVASEIKEKFSNYKH